MNSRRTESYGSKGLNGQQVTYADAIRMSIFEEMKKNKKILVYGLGVDDPTGMYGTTSGYVESFGSNRCFDTPLSEDAMTGYGIGLAMRGYRPIHVHQRADFLLLCMNQLINMAAKIKYVSNDQESAPLIVRAIIGRSWGQGAQHSQSLYSLFGNIPGLEVLVPATANDVYNTYKSLLKQSEPAIVIEHRMLYKTKSKIIDSGQLPESTQISRGNDITVVSLSHASLEAQRGCQAVEKLGVMCDHFTVSNIKRWGKSKIHNSARKTGKVLIVDNGWLNCSVAHSIAYQIFESGYTGEVKVMGYKDHPCPTAKRLEESYYPDAEVVANTLLELCNIDQYVKVDKSEILQEFKGPF